MISGYLIVLNSHCKKDLSGVYTVFVPTTDREKAEQYVEGNGTVLGVITYNVDTDLLSDDQKLILFNRLVAINDE